MTTPTTNFGWPKPDATEYASITGVNTVIDAIDTSMDSVADTMGAIIRPMGMMKMVESYVVPNITVKYLTGYQSWESKWFVDGTVPGTAFGTNNQPIGMYTDGTFEITTAGLYRLTYNLNFLGYYGAAEGYWLGGVYNPSAVMVPRTKCIVRMQTLFNNWQTMYCSTLLRATSGGDLELNTLYKFGVYQDMNVSVSLSTQYEQADPYWSYYTLEYVRGL